MRTSNFKEALQLLNIVITHEKGEKKVHPLLQKVKCEIGSARMNEAMFTSLEIAQLIQSPEFKDEDKAIQVKCEKEIEFIVEKFMNAQYLQAALLLKAAQFYLIQNMYSDEIKINKNLNLSYSMLKLCQKSAAAVPLKLIKQVLTKTNCFKLMDEILVDLQKISKVSLKVKTNSIAWHLCYFGRCCVCMKDASKALKLYDDAIFVLKSKFGNSTSKYKMYAYCIQNYGDAFKKLYRFVEARQMYEEALIQIEKVTDWNDTEEKSVLLSATILLYKETNKIIRNPVFYVFYNKNVLSFFALLFRNGFLFLLFVLFHWMFF